MFCRAWIFRDGRVPIHRFFDLMLSLEEPRDLVRPGLTKYDYERDGRI